MNNNFWKKKPSEAKIAKNWLFIQILYPGFIPSDHSQIQFFRVCMNMTSPAQSVQQEKIIFFPCLEWKCPVLLMSNPRSYRIKKNCQSMEILCESAKILFSKTRRRGQTCLPKYRQTWIYLFEHIIIYILAAKSDYVLCFLNAMLQWAIFVLKRCKNYCQYERFLHHFYS